MANTVEKIEELTVFRTTDGKFHETMDAACDHQEKIDFRRWCDENLDTRLQDPEDIADQIMRAWKVQPRE